MSHLDDRTRWVGHYGKWARYVPVGQLWITALLDWFSIVWPLISWALPFSNTVNTLTENDGR